MSKPRFVFFALYLLTFSAPLACSKEVYVGLDTGAIGHGVLRSNGDGCFVLVPKHVVKDPGSISVVGVRGVKATASVKTKDTDADLAILAITGKSSFCSGDSAFASTESIDHLLDRSPTVIVRTVGENGALSQQTVHVRQITEQTIVFSPDGDDTLSQGMSGSVLVSRGQIIGMMTGVDHGRGIAYRADYIDEFWRRTQPQQDSCRSTCITELSELPFIKTFERKESQGSVTRTSYDSVFRLPESWPFPQYIHIWTDRLDVQNDLVSVPPNISISGLSFSADVADRAADVFVSVIGYDGTGQAMNTIIYKEKVWSITLSGGQEPLSMSLRVKDISLQ